MTVINLIKSYRSRRRMIFAGMTTGKTRKTRKSISDGRVLCGSELECLDCHPTAPSTSSGKVGIIARKVGALSSVFRIIYNFHK